MGFFVICSGVVLLQLSKSAKDVPDTAVFAGNLDQVRTIAEQEQPESEPKADAIRGAGLGTIVRRFSVTRQKMEEDELRRLHEEKKRELEAINENGQFEWDGLRRRRTTYGSQGLTPFPPMDPHTPHAQTPHPPLGMSHFPSESDSDQDADRPNTAFASNFLGSIRTRARSIIVPGQIRNTGSGTSPIQSPMHPVPLTEISIPGFKGEAGTGNAYYGHDGRDNMYNLPISLQDQKTAYEGAGAGERHITIRDPDMSSQRTGSRGSAVGPTPPPHSARRQFSFQNVFRKGQANAQSDEPMPAVPRSPRRLGLGSRSGGKTGGKGATEEERLGLVTGDSHSMPALPNYDDDDEGEDEWSSGPDDKPRPRAPRAESDTVAVRGRGLTSPREPTRKEKEAAEYEAQRRKWNESRGPPPPPPPFDDGNGGAFI